jgi:MYXO-CTERM domain-containing protein
MILGAAKLRLTFLAGMFGLLAAGRAHAQTTTCNTDIDCPGTACGTQVCVKSSGGAQCMDPNTAHASGVDDGWCADSSGNPQDSNCKCRSLGANCSDLGFYCSFTIPPDGGATGTGGTGGGGGRGAVDGGGGGNTGTGGVSGSMGSGGSKTSSGGGCSVAGDPSTGLGGAGAALLLAAALVRRRARHRA